MISIQTTSSSTLPNQTRLDQKQTDRYVIHYYVCTYMLNMCKWCVSECTAFVCMDLQGPHVSKCYYLKSVHEHSKAIYICICI